MQQLTWRQVLKRHSAAFFAWLAETDREYSLIDGLATKLSTFLIARIGTPFDARHFWNTIPEVRRACNNPSTYDLPWAAEAYAFVHLLERYRRTWAVLKHLTSTAVLPLAAFGVRVLDIGAGPAPALYAIDDYYAAIGEFAQVAGIKELSFPGATLDCIEYSAAMAQFMRTFSEHCRRRGPFGPTVADFTNLDFAEERAFEYRNYRFDTYWDSHSNREEEMYDPGLAAEQSNRLFRYRLIVFSNFLTLGTTVAQFDNELRALFRDMRPGSVAVVLGGTGDEYQDVYAKLAQIAADAQLRQDKWDSDALGALTDGRMASRIKTAQHSVYQHIEELTTGIGITRDKNWPDYWTPTPSSRSRSKFGLRVFRRGRWPR